MNWKNLWLHLKEGTQNKLKEFIRILEICDWPVSLAEILYLNSNLSFSIQECKINVSGENIP